MEPAKQTMRGEEDMEAAVSSWRVAASGLVADELELAAEAREVAEVVVRGLDQAAGPLERVEQRRLFDRHEGRLEAVDETCSNHSSRTGWAVQL